MERRPAVVETDGRSLEHAQLAPLPDDYIVDTLAEVARRWGISLPTLFRERKRPGGPEVVQLSARRLGMTRRQQREYQARRSLRPGR